MAFSDLDEVDADPFLDDVTVMDPRSQRDES